MSQPLLHVFAVNGDLGDMRHTYLTRANDDPAPDLPPLSDWLGTGVDSDAVELFPLSDLAPMNLPAYLRDAFDLDDDILAPHGARLRALQGHVLLVPDSALEGEPSPGADVTPIAALPLPRANQSQRGVPSMPEPPQAAPPPEAPAKKPMSDARMSGMVAMAALAVLFALVLVMVLIA